MMRVTKPIIVVGTGRCGSTAFHRVLVRHPDVMWFSPFVPRFPDKPAWNRWAVTAMDNPLLRRLVGRRLVASEAYPFWDRYTYGFSTPCRDLVGEDVTPRVKKQVHAALEPMLTPRRHRLLVKITGWPRMGFLNGLFDDAKFIHIVRDGRSVANSLLHVHFWNGWRGPQGWRAGLLSEEDQATWERFDRSFVALAGLEWKIQMRAIESARRALPDHAFYEVKYEELCAQPLATYRRVLEFAELPMTAAFEDSVKAASIRSMNDRWRHDLTPAQQAILNDVLGDDLARYGYADGLGTGRIPAAPAPH